MYLFFYFLFFILIYFNIFRIFTGKRKRNPYTPYAKTELLEDYTFGGWQSGKQ